MKVSVGICFAALSGAFIFASPAHAVDMTDARVFITINGNDATCNAQPVVAGQNPNLINAGTIPCRTIQRACDIGVGIPKVHIAPAANATSSGVLFLDAHGNPGTYQENFVCRISGTLGMPVAWHIAEQVQPLGAVYLSHVPGAHKPIGEFTGDYINLGCAGCHFDGSDGDGIYIHGTAARHAVGQKTYYGTSVKGNMGIGVHMRWSDSGLITSDSIYWNAGEACVVVEDSFDVDMYANAIYRCGSTSGIPVSPKPGVILRNVNSGEFENNKALYAVSPGLRLINSPNWTVQGNHVTAAGYPPFSYEADTASQVGLVVGPN